MPPIGSQEVWAAGVTYFRSRDARMEESKSAGGGDFYDRVYHAARPELFFKATRASRGWARRARSPFARMRRWSVPEPELVLLISPGGKITGYTVGNDMSSRDIEGENPLYLPQAKVYDRSCALGPCLLISEEALPASTEISLQILRNGAAAFSGSTTPQRNEAQAGGTGGISLSQQQLSLTAAFCFTGTGRGAAGFVHLAAQETRSASRFRR